MSLLFIRRAQGYRRYTSAHVVDVIEPAREKEREGGREMAIFEQKKQYVVRMQSNAVTNWKNSAPRVEKVKLNIRFAAACER